MNLPKLFRCCLVAFATLGSAEAQLPHLNPYNITWTSQSKNASESMPCGGGDMGLNVWVEGGELLFYISRSSALDEQNILPKLGRVRVKLAPDPFDEGTTFRQELKLQDGAVYIRGSKGRQQVQIKVWVDVFHPVAHVAVTGNIPTTASATYESWRTEDRELQAGELFASPGFRGSKRKVIAYKDSIAFKGSSVRFVHRNRSGNQLFDFTVNQQGLDSVKRLINNPLEDLAWGGMLWGKDMVAAGNTDGRYSTTPYKGWMLRSRKPQKKHQLVVATHINKVAGIETWSRELEALHKEALAQKDAAAKTAAWWKAYWQRSFVLVDNNKPDTASAAWQAGRNYQLFRYMLGCNAFGSFPTKFNGGLFTYDPEWINDKYPFTPDHRNWGGGTVTAQNQRLVYWPMLKNGDYDVLRPQLDFYRKLLPTAELRSRVYWGHDGACFTEQMESFGLPIAFEYGFKRPAYADPGVEYNAWLEYEWDTVLEFCLMALDLHQYSGADISDYLPLVNSCLRFFDEHYQYLAKRRGAKALTSDGKLVLFPGSAAETYKMTYNSATTIAGMQAVLNGLLALPATYADTAQQRQWKELLARVPELPLRSIGGKQMLSPALAWERINNTEAPQLYPVFPYRVYGLGLPGLELARNTFLYDTTVLKHRSHVGWKQDNIFAARLGFTTAADSLTLLKLRNSGRRFPAFWGPGFDWTPDHNWGGSGMIGMQEMLLQTAGDSILLFPAWPAGRDVHFRLHAPGQTMVEARLQEGRLVQLNVQPESRRKDVRILLAAQ